MHGNSNIKKKAFRRVQITQDGLKLNGTHQFLVYADDINTYIGRKRTNYKVKHRSFTNCY